MNAEGILSFSDPYRAYTEGSLFSENPIGMVIVLYEGAIDAIREVRDCLAKGDVWGRSRAINKGIKILTELLVSLDLQAGGEISANLKRLYSYIQCRLLEAHAQQTLKPLDEVERLLNTMLEGWRGAAGKVTTDIYKTRTATQKNYGRPIQIEQETSSGYGAFEAGEEFAGCVSAVF